MPFCNPGEAIPNAPASNLHNEQFNLETTVRTKNQPIANAVKLAAVAAAICGGTLAHADTVTRSLCIYDPIGGNGFIYQSFQDYITQALNWGVKFVPRPYTDEEVAVSDFKSGNCDALEITGIRNIHIVKFAGTMDMVGGLQTYDEEHEAIDAVSSPKAAKYMTDGEFEVAGIVPGGKVFLLARHKENLEDISKAAGKKVAVMSYDKQASTYANVMGASPVPASIATFGPMFNNGNVEYAYAPSFAYKALELYKGVGTDGGVANYVLGILSLQIDIHKDKFPANFGQQSREWTADTMWDTTIRRIKKSDTDIPDNFWVQIDGDKTKHYSELMVKVRQDLWNDNWYDHTMQHMLKKIRCKSSGALAECSQQTEGGAI
jgi:hypothetical protein